MNTVLHILFWLSLPVLLLAVVCAVCFMAGAMWGTRERVVATWIAHKEPKRGEIIRVDFRNQISASRWSKSGCADLDKLRQQVQRMNRRKR